MIYFMMAARDLSDKMYHSFKLLFYILKSEEENKRSQLNVMYVDEAEDKMFSVWHKQLVEKMSYCMAMWMLGTWTEDWLLSIKSRYEELGPFLMKDRTLEEIINKLHATMMETLTLPRMGTQGCIVPATFKKLSEELNYSKIRNVIYVSNHIGGYEKFVIRYEEVRLKRISTMEVLYCKGQNVRENGARWFAMMWALLLCNGCQGKSSYKEKSSNTHVISFKVKMGKVIA